MNNKVFIMTLIILMSKGLFSQSVIYVKYDAAGLNNGTSWEDAFTSLQSALNSAVSGDQIWVARGTYKPSFSYDLTNSPRYYHFRLINGVSIYGGFAGNESAVSQRINFRHGETNETILSGDLNGNGKDDNDCYHVFYHPSGLDNTAILDGFTITGGNANDVNMPHFHGGGMYNNSSSPILMNLTITKNSATNGGGLSNAGSSPKLINVVISNNKATDSGGAIFNHSSSPTLNNSVITNNSAVEEGGAIIQTHTCFPTITNSTVSNNSAKNGGVVYFVSSGQINFKNSIIWNNYASELGNQFYINGSSMIFLHYSCYSNSTNDTYITTGTFNITNNNITSNPQFVVAGNGDYRVLGVSPCVDAGLNDYNTELTDIRGFPRKLNKNTGAEGTIDMGAYEFKVNTDPLPVELTSFTASVVENKILINWQTATEVNNYGFEIERCEMQEARCEKWSNVGFVAGHGNSNSIKEYSFTDDLFDILSHNLTHCLSLILSYRLKQIDIDGKFSYSNEIIVETLHATSLLSEYTLYQNYPNPFNPVTKIKYSIPSNVRRETSNQVTIAGVSVKLIVFDILGNEVATLVNEIKAPGNYEVEWNAAGLSSGVYFYKLKTGNFSKTAKMLLIK